jgi:gas vesicle protein
MGKQWTEAIKKKKEKINIKKERLKDKVKAEERKETKKFKGRH